MDNKDLILKFSFKYKDKIYKVFKSESNHKYSYYLYNVENNEFLSYLIPYDKEEDAYSFKIRDLGIFCVKINKNIIKDEYWTEKIKINFIINKIKDLQNTEESNVEEKIYDLEKLNENDTKENGKTEGSLQNIELKNKIKEKKKKSGCGLFIFIFIIVFIISIIVINLSSQPSSGIKFVSKGYFRAEPGKKGNNGYGVVRIMTIYVDKFRDNPDVWKDIEIYAKKQPWELGDVTIIFFYNDESNTPGDIITLAPTYDAALNFPEKYDQYCIAGYWRLSNGYEKFIKYPFK